MTVFGIIGLSVLTHLPSGIDPFRAVGLHLGGGSRAQRLHPPRADARFCRPGSLIPPSG